LRPPIHKNFSDFLFKTLAIGRALAYTEDELLAPVEFISAKSGEAYRKWHLYKQ
jgi:hypothetical protein